MNERGKEGGRGERESWRAGEEQREEKDRDPLHSITR